MTAAGKLNRRLIWAATRAVLEADVYKHLKFGEKRRRRWSLFETLMLAFERLLKLTPLYEIGCRNAREIVLEEIELTFDDLPRTFDGYTVLHLTDLHLDFAPGIEHRIREITSRLAVDLCVLTGDYRDSISGGFKKVLPPLQAVVDGIRARDGILATLGNHDTWQMVEPLEAMGITVLANESTRIRHDGESVTVTGVDDPYYYYTDQAVRALEETDEDFKIALVHTPSLYDMAAGNGYSLYLCGHTHGGQICLPGGRAIIVHLRHGRKYYRGRWSYGKMIGYTGQGTGTVGMPVRFNTRSEITLIRLRRTCMGRNR